MPPRLQNLPENDGHIVSFSEYGNPTGPAIISFHGGPGSKSKPYHAERFDLTRYRVILFDQRGCGKSTPMGNIEHNTTTDILDDAERIRNQLDIEKWFVAGGSWGTTLALLYAIAHPEHTRGLLLSAVFLADADSMAWSMEDENGVARLMPDVWEKRAENFKKYKINSKTRSTDILKALETVAFQEQQEIAAMVLNWEGNLFSAQSSISFIKPEDVTEQDIASIRINMHYESHQYFIPDAYILDHISTIENIPTVIVHGRYDILCPLQKAHHLSKKLKNAELVIATSSGHKLTPEGETIQKMAYDRFLERRAQ